MSNTRPVGHPVWDKGDGLCHYPDCDRRIAVYDGKLQHLRGSGGKARGGVRARPMQADLARRRVIELELENAALRGRVAALEALDRPWVGPARPPRPHRAHAGPAHPRRHPSPDRGRRQGWAQGAEGRMTTHRVVLRKGPAALGTSNA